MIFQARNWWKWSPRAEEEIGRNLAREINFDPLVFKKLFFQTACLSLPPLYVEYSKSLREAREKKKLEKAEKMKTTESDGGNLKKMSLIDQILKKSKHLMKQFK